MSSLEEKYRNSRGQKNKDCKFNEFNLFSLSKERLTDDIITVYKYLHGENTFDN